jgi:hypothetical protein
MSSGWIWKQKVRAKCIISRQILIIPFRSNEKSDLHLQHLGFQASLQGCTHLPAHKNCRQCLLRCRWTILASNVLQVDLMQVHVCILYLLAVSWGVIWLLLVQEEWMNPPQHLGYTSHLPAKQSDVQARPDKHNSQIQVANKLGIWDDGHSAVAQWITGWAPSSCVTVTWQLSLSLCTRISPRGRCPIDK